MRLVSNWRQMTSAMATRARGTLVAMAVTVALAGVTVMGVCAPASTSPAGLSLQALDDPACGWLGWEHPACAGGAFDTPADDGIPGDNAAEGGIPAPAMVPNVDGSLSPPGTPGAI
jgi:hypothetical protein